MSAIRDAAVQDGENLIIDLVLPKMAQGLDDGAADLRRCDEVTSRHPEPLLSGGPARFGITAGASCPNKLIEDTVARVFALRGVPREAVEAALGESYGEGKLEIRKLGYWGLIG